MKPCDICLEKVCKSAHGEGNCNCETCAVRKECPKKLRATIRITLKCTQSCRHCCYESSPTKETHMSVESAKKIAKFLVSNEIYSINLMGGEVFCNPNWREILDIILPTVKYVRIVSNGDWAVDEPTFPEHVAKHPNAYIVVSKDQWHTNANIEKAEELIKACDIPTLTSDLKETEFSLVPIGRAEYSDSIYSMFGCWCHNPEHQYSFLIDEVGDIFKCGFGVWNYTDVDEHLEGGFAVRFKEFNKLFYNTFIPSCGKCIRSYKFS